MAVWQRLDEQKYLISGPTSEKPILDDPDHLVDEDNLSEDSEVDVAVDIEDADIDWGTADAELDAYLEQSGQALLFSLVFLLIRIQMAMATTAQQQARLD